MNNDDEMTELVDADFPRVDLVGKAANGTRFLVAKSEAGLLPPDFVRDLVEKESGVQETEDVSKAKDLDASVVLADAKGEGDPEQPGSGAWEAIDAATAMKWSAILSRAANAVQVLAAREEMEAFSDVDDGMSALDLENASCCIQEAINWLAPYAMAEQSEANMASDGTMDGIMKAADALGSADSPLAMIEAFSPVIKAGRTLSSANESRIREAVSSLQQVLSSLPAPTQEVAKMDAMTETSPYEEKADDSAPDPSSVPHMPEDAPNAGHEVAAAEHPVAVPNDVQTGDGLKDNPAVEGKGTNPGTVQSQVGVAKADKSLMAVFSQSGKMIGVVDPEKIQTVQTGEDAAPADETPEEQPAADSGEQDPSDLTPAAPGAQGMSADNSVMKAAIDQVVKAALDAQAEQHAQVVKALEDRLERLEAPAPSRVLSNGAKPLPQQMRGQDREGGTIDAVAKASDALHEEWSQTTDVTKRAALEQAMNQQAADALAALRASQAQRR